MDIMSASNATSKFRAMLADGNYVILDTETTGTDRPAEICSIAIIDSTGKTLLDTFVKPARPIPLELEHIHGISNQTVEDSPRWPVIAPTVKDLLKGRNVVIYNATFDRKMLHLSDESNNLDRVEWKEIGDWYCAMLIYAEYRGEIGNYGSFKWQKLGIACQQMGIEVKDAHNALGDCKMTLRLCEALANDETWLSTGKRGVSKPKPTLAQTKEFIPAVNTSNQRYEYKVVRVADQRDLETELNCAARDGYKFVWSSGGAAYIMERQIEAGK